MTEKTKYLLAEMVELARMSADHCIDFEKEMVKNPNPFGIPAEQVCTWLKDIARIASQGQHGCSLVLEFPNPERRALSIMKTVVKECVENLFSFTGFRITQFGDWSLIRSFANVSHEAVDELPTLTIHVLFGITWRGQ